MKTIAYVIPYFGKLPSNFSFWLMSCEKNPTIDWFIFTDDTTEYHYPDNVKPHYMSFDEMKKKIQVIYDFQIFLDRPWKLCDYRVAYGEIFYEELQGYDFWGHCDIDLLWGNIRKFLTEDILNQYEKIGNQGHSTLYKNKKTVNERYRIHVEGMVSYEEVFKTGKSYGFDEKLICDMYDKMEIPYYKETIYAHLNKYEPSFYLGHLSKDDIYKNKIQIFQWKNGSLIRFYLHNGNIYQEEFMYIHFWCRPMKYMTEDCSSNHTYVMYPDIAREYNYEITSKFLKRYGHQNKVKFLIKALYFNRKKLTFKRILFNIGSFSRYRKRSVR